MAHPVITLDDPTQPPRRTGGWLHNKRMVTAGAVALFEVIAYRIIDPPRWVGIVLVGAALAAFIALSGKMKPGLTRDLVLVLALAQALLLALPILIGFVSLIVATVLVLLLIALFVVIGLRFRR